MIIRYFLSDAAKRASRYKITSLPSLLIFRRINPYDSPLPNIYAIDEIFIHYLKSGQRGIMLYNKKVLGG
jgi:hypothetical protein